MPRLTLRQDESFLREVVDFDVIQTLVLITGAVLPLFLLIFRLPGSVAEIAQVGIEHHKFDVGPMSWNLAERTFPIMAPGRDDTFYLRMGKLTSVVPN